MKDRIEPIDLPLPQVKQAATMMTNAFIEDPLYREVLPVQEKRRKALLWLHARVIRYCSLYGLLNILPRLEGIACWLPPGQTRITIARIIRSGLLVMPFRLGFPAYTRFNSYMEYSDTLRNKYAPEAYWYLWVLAVNPSQQSRGLGTKLLKPVLERADSEAIACYLETENKENLRFYEKNGFRVVASGAVPGCKITTWSMIREPVPHSPSAERALT